MRGCHNSVTAALFSVCIILLAGCGGGGSGGGALPSVPHSTTVTLLITDAQPQLVAYEQGTRGAWTLLPAGQESFSVSGSGAYGVAWVCPDSSPLMTDIVQTTLSELTTIPVACSAPVLDATVSGTIQTSAIADVEFATVNGSTVYGFTDNSGTYSISVAPGSQDIMAAVTDSSENLLAIHTLSNVDVPSSGLTGENITFDASDAMGPSATVTFANLPTNAGATSGSSVYYGNPNDRYWLGGGTGTSCSYLTMPAADLGADSNYDISAYSSLGVTPGEVTVELFTSTPPASMTYPNPLSVASPTNTDTPAFSLDYTGFSGLSGGQMYYEIEESISNQPVFAVVTPGFLSASGSTYALPDVNPSGGSFPATVGTSGDLFEWSIFAEYASTSLFQSLGPFYFADVSAKQNPHAQSVTKLASVRVESASPLSGFVYTASTSGTPVNLP